jgi:hypothetical protein
MERRLKRSNPQVAIRIRLLRRDIEAASGLPTRGLRMMLGPILAWISKREDRRLANGVTYEPHTFVERHNWLEESAESTQFRVVQVAQRGFRPSSKSIAARVKLPEGAALTVIVE